MVDEPLVSVGIPTFNNPNGLQRTLESITGQTYQNLEIIISDNASPTPEVERIAREFERSDARIRYHRQEENKGVWFNFQFVLEQAGGKYFMWAADDDYWLPEFISKMAAELERNPDSSVALCGMRRLLDNKSEYDVIRFSGKADPSRMSHFQLGMALAAGKKYNIYLYGLYRTEFLRLAAQRLPSVQGCDRLFASQVALATKFSYVDEILYIRNVHSVSFKERFKDDPYGVEFRNFFYAEKNFLHLGPYLCRSKIIPIKRKLYIPLLVLQYGAANLLSGRRMRHFLKSGFSRRKNHAQSDE